MKTKRLIGAILCAAMLLSTSSCLRSMVGNKSSDSGTSSGRSDTSNYSSEEYLSQPEYGNETVGWFTLDDSFFQWYTPGNTDTCVQYAKSPYEILSMDVIDAEAISQQAGTEFTAKEAASVRMYQIEEDAKTTNIEKITGAREALGAYDAYQVYCFYPDDDQYLVMWYMDSPDKTKVYYVAAEFRSNEMSFFDYAQTYKMPGN